MKNEFESVELSEFKRTENKWGGTLPYVISFIYLPDKNITLLAKMAGSPSDKAAGVHLCHHIGDKIQKGDCILTIYADSRARLKQTEIFYKKSKPIKVK